MTKFGDLKTKAGLTALNKALEAHAFADGFSPSQVDVTSFDAISGAKFTMLELADVPHVLRWFLHVKSFNKADQKKWPASGTGVSAASVSNGDAAGGDDDDDVDLFGSDDEDDAEKERVKKERLEAYAAKKAKKPGPIAKSSIILDIKPWDDETDMAELEKMVRGIKADGLVWNPASKLVPVAFGIKKLQINCVVEDDKIGTDFLEEKICEFEDFVQSVDIAAFNKV